MSDTTVEQNNASLWTLRDFDWGIKGSDGESVKGALGAFSAMKASGDLALSALSAKNLLAANTTIKDLWSVDYFVASKRDVGMWKDSMCNAGSAIKDGRIGDAAKHLVNALGIAGQLFVHVEVMNFVKGLLGTLVSTLKIPAHAIAGVTMLILLPILGGSYLATGSLGKDDNPVAKLVLYLSETFGLPIENEDGSAIDMKAYGAQVAKMFSYIGKDVVSAIACFGHMIPSWVPPVLMALNPPAGALLLTIKFLTKFAGVTDLSGYGFSSLLLSTEAWRMPWDKHEGLKIPDGVEENLDDFEGLQQLWDNLRAPLTKEKSNVALDAWDAKVKELRETHKDDKEKLEALDRLNYVVYPAKGELAHLVEELNPLKSVEGALLTGFGLHVFLEGVASILDHFFPGCGTLAKHAIKLLPSAISIITTVALVIFQKLGSKDTALSPLGEGHNVTQQPPPSSNTGEGPGNDAMATGSPPL